MAAKSKALSVALADIAIGDRIQPLDEAQAKEIAASFEAHGQLLNKIGLRHTPAGEQKWVLVHGRHRLRALELCGVVELIEGEHFTRMSVDAEQARLIEIEENMARTDVSPFARAVMLAAYREASGAATGKGGDRKSAAFFSMGDSFAAHAMRVFDLARNDVQRLLQIGTRLSRPEGLAERLHFSRIARNQSQLLKLAALPEEQLARAAEAFDAAKGDYFNLMALLSQAPSQQSALLARIKAGASLGEIIAAEADAAAESKPGYDHWQQAISAFDQLDFKGRVTAAVAHFKRDEKAIREALKSQGYEIVRIGGKA
jgi:ParB-like chromosome segregation protein Spo0J